MSRKNIISLFVVAFFAVVLLPSSTYAMENDTNYVYKAKPGDSYSVLARKAIQTYGITENVKLSLAQIIAGETNLAKKAGFPSLNISDEIIFKKDEIKEAVDHVQKLSKAELLAWKQYVPYVDFDTRKNG